MALVHPEISPNIFEINIFGFNLHPTWYGMMYVLGFGLGLWLGVARCKKRPGLGWTPEQASDLLTWLMLGTILGGRIGYVIFYILIPEGITPLLHDFMLPLRVWDGGMSFHGGLIGVTLACFAYAYKYHRYTLDIGDFIAPLVPFGLFFGRLGNFINGELWGRPTDLPWGMIFQHAPDQLPRHPSQLYEAFWEGIILFTVLNIYAMKPRQRGRITGMFLIVYAIGRFLVEFVREKDAQMSYYISGLFTMGQLLTIPMLIIGLYLLLRPVRDPALSFEKST